MKISIFAVYDKKLKQYNRPFPEMSVIQATRGFHVAVTDPSSQLSHFPKDFELHEVGSFDDESGKLTNNTMPTFVQSAMACVKIAKEIDDDKVS